MSIQANSEVLKQDIAESLVSQTGSFRNYLTSKPNYTINSINSLFSNAVYVNANFDPTIFCKRIVFPSIETLFGINRNNLDQVFEEETARFDTLSSMFLSVAMPLTNIRKSEFVFLERNDNGYEVKSLCAYVALADDAILGNNQQLYANNRNENPKIISTESDFVQYGQIADGLTQLTTTSHRLSVNTLNSLSSLFVTALSNIADNSSLSCRFTDDYDKQIATLTYNSEQNDMVDGNLMSSVSSIRYFSLELSGYDELFPNQLDGRIFGGWTTIQDSDEIQISAGESLLMDSDKVLYPAFKPQVTVVYTAKADSEYGTYTSFTSSDNFKLNENYTISDFTDFIDDGSLINDWEFVGWTTSTTGTTVTYRPGDQIQINTIQTITLYPVIKRTRINSTPTLKVVKIPYNKDDGRQNLLGYHLTSNNGTKLSTILEYVRGRGINLPDMSLLVGIRGWNELTFGKDPNKTLTVRLSLAGSTYDFWRDRQGDTYYSAGYGAAIWRPNNAVVSSDFSVDKIASTNEIKSSFSYGTLQKFNGPFSDTQLNNLTVSYNNLGTSGGTASVYIDGLAYIDMQKSTTTTYARIPEEGD